MPSQRRSLSNPGDADAVSRPNIISKSYRRPSLRLEAREREVRATDATPALLNDKSGSRDIAAAYVGGAQQDLSSMHDDRQSTFPWGFTVGTLYGFLIGCALMGGIWWVS